MGDVLPLRSFSLTKMWSSAPAVEGFSDEAAAAYKMVFDYLAIRQPSRRAEAIFCFGSGDITVAHRAAELYMAGIAPMIITTGGVPYDAQRCEADAFADRLLELGVPADHVVRERDSRHTGENVVLGTRALRSAIGPIRSLVAVCWPFAARRCLATFARYHPDIQVTAEPALHRPNTPRPISRRSLKASIAEVERLIEYQEIGYITCSPVPSEVNEAVEILRTELMATARMIVT